MPIEPKTAKELLDLPEWEPFYSVTVTSEAMRDEWQPFVDFKLKVGYTIQVPREQTFEPNGIEPDTVMLARDGAGQLWVQMGRYKRRIWL